jgi:uncharacterized protein (DUF488 family)
VGPRILTVGHGTRPIDAFLALLGAAGVRVLVDVRRFPGSRRNPQYAREALRAALEEAGIAYVWMGEELGGFRSPVPGSRHTALAQRAFAGYADHMDTPAFRRGLERLIALARERPVAVMCAETLWWRCHRRMLADALLAAGCEVLHLLEGGPQPHALHPNARIEDGRPVYDVEVQPPLV